MKVSRTSKRTVLGETKTGQIGKLPTDFSSISSTWSEADRSNVPAGAGESQRVGRHIAISGVHLEGVLSSGVSNLATDDKYNLVRIVIGIWTTATPCAGLDRDLPIDKWYQGKGKLIRKIYDQVIPLESPGRDSTGYMPALRKVSIHRRFKNPVICTYADDTVNYPDKRVVFSFVSDSGVVTNPGFIEGYYHIEYMDV